jgi:thiamine biosynthesis lipoprotein
VTVAFHALGTTAVVATTNREREGDAVAAVERELHAVDFACSRFRPDSELARVNRSRGERVQVSPLLFAALRIALSAAKTTGGLVDPTVGRALRTVGYDRTFTRVVARDASAVDARFSVVPGWRVVELDETTGSVRVPAGVELDLGATAKAFACDRSAAAAAAVGGGALVALGGDIAVDGEAPDGGWPVRITDDHAAGTEAPGPIIAVAGGGLATSSTTVRRWRSRTEELNHLIDPRTGRPARSPWRTVSVAAASCVDANIASTASFFLDDAPAWLAAHRLPSRLVSIAGERAWISGWPEDPS